MREYQHERDVRELLARRFNVNLRKLPECSVKTADYELLPSTERAAVLEVKFLDRVARTPENQWEVFERDGITQAERDDNAPNRVARAIHRASKQLRGYAEPKILVFVNDESLMDVQDLDEAYNGLLDYGDDEVGYTNIASAKISDRIQEEKKVIDLYIWIDRHRPSEPLFRLAIDRGLDLARRFFGYATSNVGA